MTLLVSIRSREAGPGTRAIASGQPECSRCLDVHRYRAFRREHGPRFLERLSDGEAECLEGRLDDVVLVAAAEEADVEGRLRVVAEGAHPVVVEWARQRPPVVGATAEVERDVDE